VQEILRVVYNLRQILFQQPLLNLLFLQLTQGLAGNAGQAYAGFDALSGVAEVGGFGYDALPTGLSPDQILQAPAGSM
jgi:hypothetical protein